MEWDVFISHAWEDKESFARPLAKELAERGLRVWFDEFTLRVGDSLRRSIDYGLSHSRYGIVILSPHFFAKEWPQKELDALVSRESFGQKVILPIWHNITAEQVRKFSPLLADRIAISSEQGLEYVVATLISVIKAIEPQAIKDQIALLSFVDDMIKERQDPNITEKNIEAMRAFLLWKANEAINTHLITLLTEDEQIELDALLDRDASNEELDNFFRQKIPNLAVEIATALINFRAAYLYPLYKDTLFKEK